MIDFNFDYSADNQIIIDYGSGVIDNNLLTDDFKLTESLMSSNSLTFGNCEASQLVFNMLNNGSIESLKNVELNVSIVNNDNVLNLGTYRVDSDVLTDDRNYRTITAYDSLYNVLNKDFYDWYNTNTYPMTLKAFREAFCEFNGIVAEPIDLVNDDLVLTKMDNVATITGKQILNAICEINGVYGHIGRDGVFKYISLTDNTPIIIEDYASPLKYEDYVCQPIESIKIVNNDGDLATVVGSGVTYTVTNNFTCYDKDTTTLEGIANKLLSHISNVTYRPVKNVQTIGNPAYEVGDAIEIDGEYTTVNTYILERVLTGIQGMKDEYNAKGTEIPQDNPNSMINQVNALMGNVQVSLSKTEKGLASKVSKGEVISEINQSPEEVTINGNKINLNGVVTANANFKILEDGSMQTNNGKFTGSLVCATGDEQDRNYTYYFNLAFDLYGRDGAEKGWDDVKKYIDFRNIPQPQPQPIGGHSFYAPLEQYTNEIGEVVKVELWADQSNFGWLDMIGYDVYVNDELISQYFVDAELGYVTAPQLQINSSDVSNDLLNITQNLVISKKHDNTEPIIMYINDYQFKVDGDGNGIINRLNANYSLLVGHQPVITDITGNIQNMGWSSSNYPYMNVAGQRHRLIMDTDLAGASVNHATDASYSDYLRSYASSGASHGNAWLVTVNHNAFGDGRFGILVGGGAIETRVHYASYSPMADPTHASVGSINDGSNISDIQFGASNYMHVNTRSHGSFGVNWWASDTKLKENIEPTTETALDKIKAIDFIQFDWKANKEHQPLGVSANQIKELMPECIIEIEQPEDYEYDTLLNIDTGKMTTYALKAIQELTARVEELEKKLAEK